MQPSTLQFNFVRWCILVYSIHYSISFSFTKARCMYMYCYTSKLKILTWLYGDKFCKLIEYNCNTVTLIEYNCNNVTKFINIHTDSYNVWLCAASAVVSPVYINKVYILKKCLTLCGYGCIAKKWLTCTRSRELQVNSEIKLLHDKHEGKQTSRHTRPCRHLHHIGTVQRVHWSSSRHYLTALL